MKPTFAKLFDPRVASHAVRFSDVLEPLFEEEARCVERAVEKRRHEFRAGRHCARAALRTLGEPAGPILRQADRTAKWPPGWVGSITHTGDLPGGFAAAVVAPESVALGLGVDAESDSDLSAEISQRILTEAEHRFLDRQPERRRGQIAKLFFCAKEAFYKCQYPVTERFLGFEDVELTFDLEAGTFRATLVGEVDEALERTARAEGRFVIDGGLVIAGAQLLREKSN